MGAGNFDGRSSMQLCTGPSYRRKANKRGIATRQGARSEAREMIKLVRLSEYGAGVFQCRIVTNWKSVSRNRIRQYHRKTGTILLLYPPRVGHRHLSVAFLPLPADLDLPDEVGLPELRRPVLLEPAIGIDINP